VGSARRADQSRAAASLLPATAADLLDASAHDVESAFWTVYAIVTVLKSACHGAAIIDTSTKIFSSRRTALDNPEFARSGQPAPPASFLTLTPRMATQHTMSYLRLRSAQQPPEFYTRRELPCQKLAK
jgi:hypothetical protein